MPLSPNGKLDLARLAGAAPAGDGGARGALAPRDELERRLAGIFEDLLGVSPIGVEADFFALGGHSLLAVKLLSRIEQQLGAELPLAAVFEDAASVERLARRLREDRQGGCLVRLQDGGPAAPLFCAQPAGGDAATYRALAARVGGERPVYGLRPPDNRPLEE